MVAADPPHVPCSRWNRRESATVTVEPGRIERIQTPSPGRVGSEPLLAKEVVGMAESKDWLSAGDRWSPRAAGGTPREPRQ